MFIWTPFLSYYIIPCHCVNGEVKSKNVCIYIWMTYNTIKQWTNQISLNKDCVTKKRTNEKIEKGVWEIRIAMKVGWSLYLTFKKFKLGCWSHFVFVFNVFKTYKPFCNIWAKSSFMVHLKTNRSFKDCMVQEYLTNRLWNLSNIWMWCNFM